MAIVKTDIKFFLSGGANNVNPEASLGGIPSTTEIDPEAMHNIFDKVIGDESFEGDTEYRIIYLRNTHATLTAERLKLFFIENYLDELSIGLKDAINTNAAALQMKV